MIIALAEEGVKSAEDLAGCVADDLTGWTERVDGEKKHYEGMLEKFRMKPDAAEALIAEARHRMGWDEEEEEGDEEPVEA
jgi:N utilization substance protein A